MSTVSKSKKLLPVILLFGPTAIGKSSIIFTLFGSGCEIINADSQQVYKYLDIGTAKPDKKTCDKIPHHCVNLIDPKNQYNAGNFVKQANSLVLDIINRGRIPLVAGGTGFYLKNFIYGLPEAPPSDINIREKIKRLAESKGLAYLYKQLLSTDPEYADCIEKNDALRIIRALEVYEISGRPLSSFTIPQKERDDIVMYKIGLTLPRHEIYLRINNRVETMFEKGLVNEVRSLIRRGFTPADPGMKSIGYREFFLIQAGCFLFKEVKELIKKNSRHYAKRQITFFKSFHDIHWHHPEDYEGIKVGIIEFLKKIHHDFSIPDDLFA